MKENQTSGDEARSPSDSEAVQNETETETLLENRSGIEGNECQEEVALNADELLQQGKAALKFGDVELAVEKFSEAVEKK